MIFQLCEIFAQTFDPDSCEDGEDGEGGRGEMEVEGCCDKVEVEGGGEGEEGMEVTDIDDFSPTCLMKKIVLIPGLQSVLYTCVGLCYICRRVGLLHSQHY